MQRFLNQLIPFFVLGMILVIFAFGIVLLAYLFIISAIIGFVLFIFSWIKNRFFTKPAAKPPTHTKVGRIIDSDDWREL